MKRHFTRITLIISTLFLTACGHVISTEGRSAVETDLPLAAVQKDADGQMGKKMLLGGLILGEAGGDGEHRLEILAYRLDRWGEPIEVSDEGIHFLAAFAQPLDARRYDRGRLITLTGTVGGLEVMPLGPSLQNYRFPIITVAEHYLWETPFREGIHPGPNLYAPSYVGEPDSLRQSPYDPGYAPHPYTPYWYRPPGTSN